MAIVVGPYVFVTVDSAKRFSALKLPIQRSFYGVLRSVVSDSNTVYVESKDIDNRAWMVVTSDRGQTWDSVLDPNGIIPNGGGQIIVHASGPNLVLYVPPNVLISTDRGQTWADSLKVIASNNIMPAIGMASPSILYCVDTGGTKEWSWQNRQWSDAPLSASTIWYRYFGSSIILAQEQSGSKNLRLRRSTNRGASWLTINTIRFVNSDTVIVPDVLHFIRADDEELSATFRLRSGAVFSTTDAGDTWILRGMSSSSDAYSDVENELSTLKGISTILPQAQQYYCIIPSGTEQPLQRRYGVPYGIPMQVSDSILLLAKSSALYKSTDAGWSWFILGEEFHGYSGVFRNDEPDLQPYSAERLWWGHSDSLYSRAQFDYYYLDGTSQGSQLRLTATQFLRFDVQGKGPQRWYYPGFTLDDPHLPINESNSLQPFVDSSSSLLVRIRLDDFEVESEGRIFFKRYSKAPVLEVIRKRTHYAWQVRSGEVLLMADSLLISADTGQTWRALPSSGLPLDSAGNIATVTSFCEGPNGEWYMGLSGAVIVTAEEETGREPGGVVRSRDRGLTWQRLSGLPEPTHVFHVACDGTGVVFASTTQRSYGADRPTGRKEQDYMSQVFRISGDTAELSYSEYLSGPPTKAGRVLRRDQRGVMLYATMREGLKRSTDGGLSWQQVGDDALDTMTIKDVVVARDNGLYVGTTIGVFESNALTLGVDVEEDASRRTTVWCYPTPATTSLRIRLNNMDLVNGTAPKLILCTIKGEEVLNFREEVRRSLGSKQTEFDADVSNLPRGTYALVLQAGKSSAFHKVLIVR
ncbi:MAG: hypothetical protein H7X70_03915 [Candidatus Kapabacteria bacterium]|nr:hypothetical protein [Candidatus Kapabacteria bacterium]